LQKSLLADAKRFFVHLSSLLEKLAPKTPSGARKASLALAGFEKHRLNVYYVGKAGESTQLPE
jgi:hypothetical protein